MEEVIGQLLRTVAGILSRIYDVIPSYGIAIVILVLFVRLLLLPFTIKQTRSMQAMQKLQPQIKAIQKKYKGRRDRDSRTKMNEEMMALYKEAGANPLGGCLPLVLQIPVFISLFAVLRAFVPAVAIPVEPVQFSDVQNVTICRPDSRPSVTGVGADEIVCERENGDTERFAVGQWMNGAEEIDAPPSLLSCVPIDVEGEARFRCESAKGSGHLPKEGELFSDIVEGRASFLGMHLSCGATQAQDDTEIRRCAPPGASAGGFPLVGYYGLIALMGVSTWYQFRQTQAANPNPAQMKMMGRIMPVVLVVFSLNFPAGLVMYWVTSNVWQIVQQRLILKPHQQDLGTPKQHPKQQQVKDVTARDAGEGPGDARRARLREEHTTQEQPQPTPQPRKRSRRARGRKKRR